MTIYVYKGPMSPYIQIMANALTPAQRNLLADLMAGSISIHPSRTLGHRSRTMSALLTAGLATRDRLRDLGGLGPPRNADIFSITDAGRDALRILS